MGCKVFVGVRLFFVGRQQWLSKHPTDSLTDWTMREEYWQIWYCRIAVLPVNKPKRKASDVLKKEGILRRARELPAAFCRSHVIFLELDSAIVVFHSLFHYPYKTLNYNTQSHTQNVPATAWRRAT